MPNFVKTIIHFADSFDMGDFRRRHLTLDEESGGEAFDFNTVVRMPDEVGGVPASSDASVGTTLALAAMCPSLAFRLDGIEKADAGEWARIDAAILRKGDGDGDRISEESIARSEEYLKNRPAEDRAKCVAYGKAYVANKLKYGAGDWYEWAIRNWGTKWNASETFCSDDGPGDKSIEFQTAWDTPDPILMALSREYPEEMMLVVYADEDAGGYNCGALLVKNGSVLREWTPGGGEDDRCAFAESVWGDEGSYRDLGLDLMYKTLRPAKA